MLFDHFWHTLFCKIILQLLLQVFTRSVQYCLASVGGMRRLWLFTCIYFMTIEWLKSTVLRHMFYVFIF